MLTHELGLLRPNSLHLSYVVLRSARIALQPCSFVGEALIWWEHFKTMQPARHEVTCTEFKKAFKDDHIPKGLMVRNMKELLALKQGNDTVYQYAQKFNSLC
jgi:hypothetical protein